MDYALFLHLVELLPDGVLPADRESAWWEELRRGPSILKFDVLHGGFDQSKRSTEDVCIAANYWVQWFFANGVQPFDVLAGSHHEAKTEAVLQT